MCAEIKERKGDRFISHASSEERSGGGTSSLKFRRRSDSCDHERHTHIIWWLSESHETFLFYTISSYAAKKARIFLCYSLCRGELLEVLDNSSSVLFSSSIKFPPVRNSGKPKSETRVGNRKAAPPQCPPAVHGWCEPAGKALPPVCFPLPSPTPLTRVAACSAPLLCVLPLPWVFFFFNVYIYIHTHML